MHIFVRYFSILSLLIVSQVTNADEPSPTFRLIQDYKGPMSRPLANQYSEGAKLFSKSDGKKEAQTLYKSQGYAFVRLQASLVPPGIEDLKLAQKLVDERGAVIITIPATGDVIKSGTKEYQNAAAEYASKFNTQMHEYYLNNTSTKTCAGIKVLETKPLEKYEKDYVKHLGKDLPAIKKAAVLKAYEFEGWKIIYVNTFISDEIYLFYKGLPSEGPFVTTWSGAATYFETEEIESEIQKKAKGIPPKLLKCFAHNLTQGL